MERISNAVMAAAESLWEAAEIADLRYINKWLDTEGDVDRRCVVCGIFLAHG